MQQPDDSYNITHEQLVRYVFKQLSPEEEAQLDDFLDANPQEADIVDGILQFCEGKGIRTREAFDKAWGEEMTGVQDHLLQKAATSPVAPRSQNRWTWLGAILFLMLAGGAFWIYGRRNADQFVDTKDVLKDTITTQEDTVATASEISTQATTSEPIDSSLPTVQCRLSEQERSAWLGDFTKEVRGYYTSAGGSDDASKSWQDYISSDTPDRDKAFQKLQQMSKTDPEAMQPRDYYALGVLYLLLKRNPSEAVHFLEAADGISRPDYNKFRLAAYLERGEYKKARAWAKAQGIGQGDWPKAAGPCLK